MPDWRTCRAASWIESQAMGRREGPIGRLSMDARFSSWLPAIRSRGSMDAGPERCSPRRVSATRPANMTCPRRRGVGDGGTGHEVLLVEVHLDLVLFRWEPMTMLSNVALARPYAPIGRWQPLTLLDHLADSVRTRTQPKRHRGEANMTISVDTLRRLGVGRGIAGLGDGYEAHPGPRGLNLGKAARTDITTHVDRPADHGVRPVQGQLGARPRPCDRRLGALRPPAHQPVSIERTQLDARSVRAKWASASSRSVTCSPMPLRAAVMRLYATALRS